MTIRLVTDSSSDIQWDFADKHKIEVVPLSVTYYEKNYKENREYDYDKHYDIYKKDPDFLPKTSQPSPKEYLMVYKRLIEEGAKDIITICISSALSGTINSARLAAEMTTKENEGVNIYLVDSLNASYSEVFLIEEALDLIKNGLTADKIVEKLNEHVKRIKTFIVIPTLRYLHLGGRISIAKYLLARLLRKKVITRVNEQGTNETAATIKTIEEGIEKMVKLTTRNFKEIPRKVAIVHARNEEMAVKLDKLLEEKIPNTKRITIRTGVTISAHTGPQAISLISDFGKEE